MVPKSVEVKVLPRRFDLIKKMYLSDKVIATNKKDLIFNWFFDQFENFQNNTSSYTYELLWKTFYEILEVERNQHTRHRILIKSHAVTNLLNTVKNYPFSHSWSPVILSSIAAFLQTSTVNATLIADVDKLFLLFVASLKIICRIYNTFYHDVISLKEAKNLANIILDILENLSAFNEEDKALLLSNSLQDLAIFMHIAANDTELEYISEKLAKRIISVLFNLKKKRFETLLTPVDISEAERPNKCLLKFFSSLQKLLMNEDIAFHTVTVSTTCGTLMKKLLSAFMIQNKSSLYSLKVVSLFFAVAGLDIPILITAKTCCNSLFKDKILNSNITVIGLSHLLEACLAVPQYFTSVAVPEGYFKPSIWLRGVSAALLDVRISKNKAAWLKCFCCLLKIAPSIIESDIVILIKNALLNISVHSKESKNHYCELFDIVLQTHSKLHQVPKFFVKLLLALTECIKEKTGGNLLVNGQILPQVQESIAKCIQELPYRQMIELWKIFIETFSTLENMSHAFMVSKGFTFFVAQIFSTFLLHAQLFQANIPSNINSQFSNLIESTCDEIKKNISSLKETDSKVGRLQSSILLLCYAVGEVKLLYKANHGELPGASEISIPQDTFDFSVLHPYLNGEYSSVLESYMNSDDKILSFLVFQLILQKTRTVDFCSKFSQSNETFSGKDSHMHNLISVTLKCLEESCSACESWDTDICVINAKNYGTAFWMVFFKISRLVMNHLNTRDVYTFCNLLQNIILQDDGYETGAKHFILSSLKNGDFEDYKHFQTAFVSALWKRDNLLCCKKRSHKDMETSETSIDKIFTLLNSYTSKSLKYAQRNPKSNKKLGSIWNEIEELSCVLNHILSSESLPKDKLIVKRTRDVIKILSSLPLRYLLPGNQMKSVIGLSLIFFLIPQSCEKDEAKILSEEISQQLLTIFDGARSIWLFDFIASGPYLKFVVKTVKSAISHECNDSYGWAVQLLESLVSLIVRNVNSLSSVESYIAELASKSDCDRSTLITLHSLLKKFTQVILRPHKQENYKATLIRISTLTVHAFLKQMNMHFSENVENADHCYFIKCYILTTEIACDSPEMEQIGKECFKHLPTVLEKALNLVKSSNVDTLSNVYLLYISKVCKYSSKLSTFLPENFASISWEIVLTHFEEKRKKKLKVLKISQNLEVTNVESPSLSTSNSCTLCSFYSNELALKENSKNVNHAKSHNEEALLPLSLNEYERESLKELSVFTSSEALSETFCTLLEKMDCFGSTTNDIFSLQISILIFHCLIDENIDKCAQPLLNNIIQKCLSQLHLITNEACNSLVCQTMVVLPVLDFISFSVIGNKGLSKQVLLQSLHCVIPVPLEVKDDNYELFVKSFCAVWEVVYNLFMHHTPVILSTPAPFLYYVSKLLKSIIKAGAAAPLTRCDANVLQQVQLCGQNMNRLLTVISRSENEFSKLVPYLVADYVDTVQHITLDSTMKEFILLGIYRLLDICSEESIKMLAVNINYVCREIYANLIKQYRQNKNMAAA